MYVEVFLTYGELLYLSNQVEENEKLIERKGKEGKDDLRDCGLAKEH